MWKVIGCWLATFAGLVGIRLFLLFAGIPHTLAQPIYFATLLMALLAWLIHEPNVHRVLERIKFKGVFVSDRPMGGSFADTSVDAFANILEILGLSVKGQDRGKPGPYSRLIAAILFALFTSYSLVLLVVSLNPDWVMNNVDFVGPNALRAVPEPSGPSLSKAQIDDWTTVGITCLVCSSAMPALFAITILKAKLIRFRWKRGYFATNAFEANQLVEYLLLNSSPEDFHDDSGDGRGLLFHKADVQEGTADSSIEAQPMSTAQ